MTDQDALAAYLKSVDVANELVACGRERGWTPRAPADGWQARGYTDATLATVVVDWGDRAEKVIVKVAPSATWDHAAYKAADIQCPDDFRGHLVLDAMPSWRMDSGGIVTFQRLAADDVTNCKPLSALAVADLPAACELIVRGLAHSWNPEPPRPVRRLLTAVLRDQMGWELGSYGSIRAWARDADLLAEEMPWLALRDEPAVCPNPLLLADDPSPLGAATAEILEGRCHGDLHLLNVLLPCRPGGTLLPEDFLLIDLGGYQRSRPLTTDPVFLMLSAIASGLGRLTPEGRQELLDHLVRPGATAPRGYLAEVVDRVMGTVAGRVTADDRGWSQELRAQLRLSIIGIATLFTSFSNLGAQARWWFFRLAARLGRDLLGDLEVQIPAQAPPATNPFHDTPVSAPAPRRPAAYAPATREVVLAWRAALSDPAAARHHLRAAYALVDLAADRGPAGAAATCEALDGLVHDAARILGDEDPCTLRLRHKLAGWTHLAGDAVTALETYRAVAGIRARVLGSNHPDTLESERRAGWPPLLDDAARQAYGS
ncbi:hypothetical protein [Phytohabitans houttuyneae]|uniref:Uncharacterized protein n=1 Tax=Phytohabitans houttuyneae TaxID=1076126 RepID=A0A6V8KRX8_9ACTN|nr:hypothetical protein [Phytohabitans houttuyneae]GFJ84586.1 hypothetical protein Phou_087660 [Phytohabitans houttuyneae]